MPSTPDANPHNQDVFTLAVGDCLNETTDMFVEDVPQVDCAAPRDMEVFDDFTVSDGSFDPVALGREADDGCTGARFEAFVGITFADSGLDVVSYKPTAQSWVTGDRLISCTVEDTAAKTIGSLRGAAR